MVISLVQWSAVRCQGERRTKATAPSGLRQKTLQRGYSH
jgi:hypothetical protein